MDHTSSRRIILDTRKTIHCSACMLSLRHLSHVSSRRHVDMTNGWARGAAINTRRLNSTFWKVCHLGLRRLSKLEDTWQSFPTLCSSMVRVLVCVSFVAIVLVLLVYLVRGCDIAMKHLSLKL